MSKDKMPPAATLLDEMLQAQRKYGPKESPKPAQAKAASKTAAPKTPEEPLRAYPVDIAKELRDPNITETLLNAQLAETLFLMRDIGFLYRNSDAETQQRGHLMNHGDMMVEASVKIADCLARLKGGGGPEEKRIRYVVEHVQAGGQGGGGPAKPENE